jgi:ornithine cyclodeaminase/alanine dehydrogenase-like protein (mu-crystallin family)
LLFDEERERSGRRNLIFLQAEDVRKALPMDEAIAAMKRAFALFSDGRAQAPLRARVVMPAHEGESLIMPTYVDDEGGEALAVKIVSVFPRNVHRGLPILHAAVLVLEASTGRPTALLEGGTLTAIRTGAASGAATDLLARPNSAVAAIFGAGVQARTQLEAICTVRSIQTVWVYDCIPARAEAFIAEMAGKGPIPTDLRAATSPQQAVAEADVVCTATTSPTPVFADADLKPGVHINGVGSYTPEMQEVPAETVARALVVVSSREAALAEAGDLIQPIRHGIIQKEHIHAELGEIVLDRKHGRTHAEQVTFFKAMGVAVQDAVAARLALQNAETLGLGQQVNW